MQAYVLKLIADEDYYATHSTTYQNLSLSTLKNDYSGFVMLTDWNDQLLDSYLMEKGKVVATTRVDFLKSSNARAMASCQPICQNVCISLSLPCCSMSSDPNDYCCRNVYTSCAPQCYYLCVPDQPVVEPIVGGSGSGSTASFSSSAYNAYLSDYNTFLSNSDLVLDNPTRPHINVAITNRCQGEALRQLVNNAQSAAVEYENAMAACLREAGFGTAVVDMMNNGGFFKMISTRMRSKGLTGKAGYRTVMFELGLGSLMASWCVNGAYITLQTKYTQYESDFKVQYNQPCN